MNSLSYFKGIIFLKMRGFTLIEIMIGMAVTSVIFLALMTLLATGMDFSALFGRTATTTEFMSDGLTQLSANIPQIVRLRACSCSLSAAEGPCSWSAASPRRDPIIDLAQASPLTLLDAEIEAGDGGTANAVTDQTLTTSLPGGAYGCGANGRAATSRGCRQRLQLVYTAPTLEAGPVASRPGELSIRFSSVAAPGVFAQTKIGDRNTRMGLSRVSCGLVEQVAGEQGTTFAINLLFKLKSNIIDNPASAIYESFHPASAKFSSGSLREVKLRFSLANLSTRGAYQWRTRFRAGCTGTGLAAGSVEDCCSGARVAGVCATCIASGLAATAAEECCSEALVAGTTCK